LLHAKPPAQNSFHCQLKLDAQRWWLPIGDLVNNNNIWCYTVRHYFLHCDILCYTTPHLLLTRTFLWSLM
jgi:hypothetical protein